MAKQYGIGIDFGATKILAGVVELTTGKVINEVKKKTHVERGPDEILKRIVETAQEALSGARLSGEQIQGIGIGAPGQVDRKRGVLPGGPNLGTADLAIGKSLSDAFHLPVVLANDVEVAALGELRFGAGRDCNNFVCVFIGTGIGSGIVRNGQLYTGATSTAGELGHTVVAYGGRICGCGARGCLEAYASRTAITREIFAELQRGRHSLLREIIPAGSTTIRSGMIAQAVAANDELAIQVITEAAGYLGAGMVSVINFYNPERIIIGGGLGEAVDMLFEIASHRARLGALRVPADKVEIVRTGLGDNGGMIGAAIIGSSETSVPPETAMIGKDLRT